MNRVHIFFTVFLLMASPVSFSQMGYLFVKKGFKKKKIYVEGDSINLRLRDGSYYSGTITLLRNDTIFLNGQPVPRVQVSEVILKKKPGPQLPGTQTLLLIGGGVGLTAAGLTLSNQEKFGRALVVGLIIGYGPLLIKYMTAKFIRTLGHRKFRIGRKFHLQVLDFHLPEKRLKSF